MAPLKPEEIRQQLLLPNAPPVDTIGRSRSIRLFTCMRPWYRAFHLSWISFFVAFLGWFSFAPVLSHISEDPSLGISKTDILNSNIISVTSTIIVRIFLGPIVEKYGSRRPQTFIIGVGACLVALSATVYNVQGLYAIRFFIGLIGGAFVPCQYWTTMMFSKEVVGRANAIAGGWGNLGAGVAHLLMAALVKGLEHAGYDDSIAWRLAMLVPAAIMAVVCFPMYFLTDDCPQGAWENRLYNGHHVHDSEAGSEAINEDQNDRVEKDFGEKALEDGEKGNKNEGKPAPFLPEMSVHAPVPVPKTDAELEELARQDVERAKAMKAAKAVEEEEEEKSKSCWEKVRGFRMPTGFWSWVVWAVAIQYAISFGVEIAIDNSMSQFYYTAFKKENCTENKTTPVLECAYYNKNDAAFIAAIFGLMNLFARALGGIWSDQFYYYWGVRGRLGALLMCNFIGGFCLLFLAINYDPALGLFILVMFSIFIQAGAGATYGVVPFINKQAVGPVSGIVGAGGNIGAVTWSSIFRAQGLRKGYQTVGIIVIVLSLLCFIIPVQNVTLLLGGKSTDDETDQLSEGKAEPIVDKEPSRHSVKEKMEAEEDRAKQLAQI